ncbi:hypothetical protein DH2020_023072 [Rehmannia glutinosa]|uniref:Late embryogenesis abundant protein LEA-2 subgroup domain-containing protein n=1 Tax=Rehmannia glutinosa TaxID=99300 RepID=A0ABR0W8S5_REHGL
MATGQLKTPSPPPLQKPPGYRNPNIPIQQPRPPKPVTALPPSFHHHHKKRRGNCCRTFCCCLCFFTGILILLLISAGGFLYLWFQPRVPVIRLKSINFTRFDVGISPDGPVLDTQITTRVEIENPNQKLGIVYDKTRVLLSAINGDVVLGDASLPGFSQEKNNATSLEIGMRVQHEVLDNGSAEELGKGFKNKNLLVNAEIRSGVCLKGGLWGVIGTVKVKVVCEGMRLSQVQGGGTVPKCRIKILDCNIQMALKVGLESLNHTLGSIKHEPLRASVLTRPLRSIS